MKYIITQDELKQFLHYEPSTGEFTWLVNRWRKRSGDKADGFCNKTKYIFIGIKRRVYRAHRLAWLYVYGEFPNGEIDHVNRNRSDNRLCNLRQATSAENKQNIGLRKDSSSGYRGVTLHKPSGLWVSQIASNGKRRYLGYFKTPKDAYDKYVKAAKELHPFSQVNMEDKSCGI